MPPITCHVLDTAQGKPAQDVIVALYKISELPKDDEDIKLVESKPFALAKTNSDGRVPQWAFAPSSNVDEDYSVLGLKDGSWAKLRPGIYKIRFQTGKYFKNLKITNNNRTFFPFVEVVFTVSDPPDAHYHIPLLLSNHSYSTYRGS